MSVNMIAANLRCAMAICGIKKSAARKPILLQFTFRLTEMKIILISILIVLSFTSIYGQVLDENLKLLEPFFKKMGGEGSTFCEDVKIDRRFKMLIISVSIAF